MTPQTRSILWADMWALSLDATFVIALRAFKIARGGGPGMVEARLMVSEKINAVATLSALAVSGRLGRTPEQAAARVFAYIAPKIRANRKRLGN